MIQAFHIVDVLVVSHCFPSFQNYGGLLIVPLFGHFGFGHDIIVALVIVPCSTVGVVICAICVTLLMFWSLFL